MKRMFKVMLSAPERGYLVRVLRTEQAQRISAAKNRANDQLSRERRTPEDHSEYVLDAVSLAEAANAMAIRIRNAKRVFEASEGEKA